MIIIKERMENGRLREITAEDILRNCYLADLHEGCRHFEVMRMIDRMLPLIEERKPVELVYARGTLGENTRVLVYEEMSDDELDGFLQELYELRPDIDLIENEDFNVDVTVFEHQIKFESPHELYSLIRGGEFS